MEILNKINFILARPLVMAIWLYQKTLSPDHGLFRAYYRHGFCKYHPSCSEYSKQVLINKGLKGLPKAFLRIIRCNPFSLGGVDLP